MQARTECTGIGRTAKDSADAAANQLQQTLSSIGSVNSASILQRLRCDIAEFNRHLPGPVTLENYAGLDRQTEIDAVVYGKLVESVVDTFDDNWPVIDNIVDPLVERLIVVDGATFPMFHESLIALTDGLKKSTNGRMTKSIVILLEELIKSDALFSAITDVSKPDEESTMRQAETETKWQSALQIIVSLPNRIANKLGGKVADSFLPDTYAEIISVHIGRAMLFLNSARQRLDRAPRLNMLSMFISKAVIVLGTRRFENFVDIMIDWCSRNSENIRVFINDALSNIDRPAIQPIAVSFLKRSKNGTSFDDIFGNLLTNHHWKHVFTVKIPLMSYHNDENLMRNLIVYLSKFSNDESILTDLLIRLLDIWGDRSALNHTSLEQHEYVTKLIIMSVKELRGTLKKDDKEKARRLLFAGTSAHLESTQAEIRGIGMITGEIVVDLLNDSDDAPRLKYEYDGMPDGAREIVENLRVLGSLERRREDSIETDGRLTAGSQEFADVGQRKLYELAIKCGIVADTTQGAVDSVTIDSKVAGAKTNVSMADTEQRSTDRIESQNDVDDLDSDDDLVPYDMSNDTPITEKLRPVYLRDFKENLVNAQSNSDPNIFAESMIAAEELILSQLPNDDASLGIELLEILVSLRENSYVENFELLKFNACVAVVVVCPKDAATYLCNKFHTKINEYSINDRLFMLNVLSESARKLSKLKIKPVVEDKQKLVRKERRRPVSNRISLMIDSSSGRKNETLYDDDFEVSPASNESRMDWQEIVNRRIESNTRRFAHPSKSPVTTMNRFNDVAASFFYPLLYGFRQRGTCMHATPKSFEDQENILLVHYLKALSTIMMAAENCVIVPKMAKEILDLAWSLRYHNQSKVRLCVIENTASVIITLPKEGLTVEIMELIYEFRAWLSDVSEDGIRGDPDSNCRSLGKNVVALIDSVFHSTLNQL